MKMLNPLSYQNISNVQESINQFFLLHETVRSLELDLLKADTELVLLRALLDAFDQNNPFEVN